MVMSANLDLVRSIYAGVERGDYSSAAWASPDIEYVVADGVEPTVVRGRDGLVHAMRNAFSVIEDWRDEPEEYRELDAARVLVLSTFRGRGKLSGLQVDQKVAELFEIHAGKITRIVVYFDRATALADVGGAE
jgi:ketosteroid isomerase-like protein